ncbi:glycosyltransferase family 39 protein [Pseudonocardia sp. C8]|uniref:glycosyltransferase family 39 protein n=1 Tax=Pseudonocardia sp. C8 TaxID=2762759 RepID=UPI001643379B|nr:glycosyltransferase family 39 protein [Pseudonocardia sp. C8]MBC3190861.1 glycosyltransferase family 39 protein [Pseudonocardia sp. C8]
MTAVLQPTRDPAGVPRLARWPVGLITAAVAAVHLVAGAIGRGYWFDEALMLAIGRHHLDWGSADQPPLAPAIAWLADTLAPGSIAVLRVVPSLATAGAVLVAALIARELGGDRRAQTVTALAQATGIWVTATGHWLTPYTLEPLGWLLIVWLLVRWIRLRDDRWLLAVGPVLGLAAQTKFQVILFAAVLVLAVLVAGPRALLRRPAFWVSALVGALIAAPTLVWQALHGWPQLAMGAVVASEAEALSGGRPGIALGLLWMSGLAGMVLLVAGLVFAGTDRRLRGYAFLALTFVALWVFFVVTAGRPYYLDGLHGALAAIGAVGFQHRREAAHRRLSWAVWPGAVLSVAAAAATLPVAAMLSAPGVQDGTIAAVQRAWTALPPDQRERTVVVTGSYIWAAFLDTAPRGTALPPVHSGNRSYGYFDPPADDHDVVIFVGEDPGVLAPAVTGLRPAGTSGSGDTLLPPGSEAGVPVWTGGTVQRPWSQAWPGLRTLGVS